MNDATATPPEQPRGVPTDAQLLDWLRRGAVSAPDGTVIGWITPGPPDDAGLRPLPEYEPPARPPAGELADWEPLADMESIRVEEQQNRVTVITRVDERVIPWRVWCEAEPHIRTDAEGFEASPGLRLMGPSWIQATKDEINKAAERLRGARPVTSLPEFLRARLDEDQQHVEAMDDFWIDTTDEFTGDAARRFTDEKRVLADIDARRRIVDMFEQYEHATTRTGDTTTPGLPSWLDGGQAALDRTLRLLALPFADHPDYRTEWRL